MQQMEAFVEAPRRASSYSGKFYSTLGFVFLVYIFLRSSSINFYVEKRNHNNLFFLFHGQYPFLQFSRDKAVMHETLFFTH